jgi:hypothetical protein
LKDKFIYTIADAILDYNPAIFTEDLSSLFGINLDMGERLSPGDIAIRKIFGDVSFKKSKKEIVRDLNRMLS